MERMNLHQSVIGLLICCSSFAAMAQSDNAPQYKRHKYTVYGGVGPNYYFNNLVRLKGQVNELNYSFAARFMWEPEHRLSIGFETGYYRLYNLALKGPKNTTIKNSAIPIQLVVSMKFLRNWYGNFSIGRSFLINDITTDANGNFDASNFSLADFSGTVGYKRRLSDHFSLGAETKYYYASKAEDANIALLFMAGYSFK
jgi:hypothetical protein